MCVQLVKTPTVGLLMKYEMWPFGTGLGRGRISWLPSTLWLFFFFLSLGPDPCIGGLFPFAGWLQKEQAKMAGSCRTAGEDAD